ncbi:MAG: terminase small subunit [Oscillospiraceae bacterium]|nr:terminase small subunit [Oscillospiraceae bacterium]
MKRENGEKSLQKRIRAGQVSRQDVTRRLAELAFGRANDCVRLALEDSPDLGTLDLGLLSEVKRNDKGTVEIRLIDRLRALEQLALMTDGENTEAEAFLQALRGADD